MGLMIFFFFFLMTIVNVLKFSYTMDSDIMADAKKKNSADPDQTAP